MEARLYTACLAAFLLPVGIFIYAWSTFPWVHWIALIIGIVVRTRLRPRKWLFDLTTSTGMCLQTFEWATFIIYHSVFTYLADWYAIPKYVY